MIRTLLIDHVTRPEEMNEPLGIQALAGALRSKLGASVATRLTLVESRPQQEALLTELRGWRPHIVGASSKIGQLEPLLELYRCTRALSPQPIFVVGDQLATLGSSALLTHAPLAVCVLGEGEEALVGIANELVAAGGELAHDALCRRLLERQVPNCTFMTGAEQQYTPRRTVDFASLGLAERPYLARGVAEGWILHAEASRGCPWSACTFCYVNHKYPGKAAWRPAPIARVIDDLARLSDAGAGTVFFTDEDFIGPDRQRVWELAQAIVDAKHAGRLRQELAFFISSAARTLLRHERSGQGVRDLLTHLRQAGVREIFLGIESGCQAQLGRYCKGVSVAGNLAAIRLVRESGIELDLGFLPFDPWTTVTELGENLEFLRRAELVHQPVRLMKRVLLTPGTPLAARWQQEHPDTKVDLNALTLECHLLDERVARIAELVAARWRTTASETYRAQASRRLKLSDATSQRAAVSEELGRGRAREYHFVRECVAAIEQSADAWRAGLAAVEAREQLLSADARANST